MLSIHEPSPFVTSKKFHSDGSPSFLHHRKKNNNRRCMEINLIEPLGHSLEWPQKQPQPAYGKLSPEKLTKPPDQRRSKHDPSSISAIPHRHKDSFDPFNTIADWRLATLLHA